jgi:hypothetical protein
VLALDPGKLRSHASRYRASRELNDRGLLGTPRDVTMLSAVHLPEQRSSVRWPVNNEGKAPPGLRRPMVEVGGRDCEAGDPDWPGVTGRI